MALPQQSVRPLRVGIVGCGLIASGTHIPNVAANPRLQLAWLCDLNEGAGSDGG